MYRLHSIWLNRVFKLSFFSVALPQLSSLPLTRFFPFFSSCALAILWLRPLIFLSLFDSEFQTFSHWIPTHPFSYSFDLFLSLVVSVFLPFKHFFRWIICDLCLCEMEWWWAEQLILEFECWQKRVFQRDILSGVRGALLCVGKGVTGVTSGGRPREEKHWFHRFLWNRAPVHSVNFFILTAWMLVIILIPVMFIIVLLIMLWWGVMRSQNTNEFVFLNWVTKLNWKL